ncbi:2,3-bisphosphoglycerate-dependent phosphoglycerate mutase [Neorhizobium tomejilense]|uniref:2,3-bisphosphoglycerate-dependent phosphoglycerate mutase n=1 Tax=Neorhizobium tomejilense TaxID=2093828 RepID=UPI003ED011A5
MRHRRFPERGQPQERILVLVRHGQSDGNLNDMFTGWKDPGLTPQGVLEARWAGRVLAHEHLSFSIAFTSKLKRAQHTLDIILNEVGQPSLNVIQAKELNERDYGDLTGLKKEEARSVWGKEQVEKWHRSYVVAPPGGESLRDTGARVLPYFITEILPRTLRGEKVLIVAHGNSLRVLIMALERISDVQVAMLEVATGVPRVYTLNSDSTVASRRILCANKAAADG